LPGGGARGCARVVSKPELDAKTEGRQNETAGCACVEEGCSTCKIISQHGTKAGITNVERDGEVVDSGVPLRLEGRGIHRGAGKRVLTSMATG
jgi:hypothetical protein